ncbi:hypothetical protein Rin_00015000 [Candidatus Regiella insecticola 5.15]|uniref:Uncharacterized protein n=1 Tax=Candidatus Regiella insecticola 5.15 TaxID=1005043 RepID=G2H0C0_9ENTR|nr:hypothetical protein [Candidatus Regiella insecticola]EGY28564.1 hypothetical protein Rin_00015000 [Candidatus Regiella insecticola 5.15]
MLSIRNHVSHSTKNLQHSNDIQVSELIDKLKNGTAKKEPSTLDKIWSVIKEFFYGTDEDKVKDEVCDALCTLFDKNSNQEYRTEALFKLMSYFTAESKQPLAWHLTPDERPRFSVSMKFSNRTFYSPTMAFSELAEAYNKSTSGWINSYTKKGLADSLYRHINYDKKPNDYNAPNDPKVYENLTIFFRR